MNFPTRKLPKAENIRTFNEAVALLKKKQQIAESLTPSDNDSSDEFIVLSNSSVLDERRVSNFYYALNTEVDYEAPYYTEFITQWRLGNTPLNPNGRKTYTYTLANFMTPELLEAYKAAGVTTFLVENLTIDACPIVFRNTTMGTTVIKISQDNYFETQNMQVSQNYKFELNSDVTGFMKQISTMDPSAIDTIIAIFDYQWFGVQIAQPLQEGYAVRNTALITLTLTPVIS